MIRKLLLSLILATVGANALAADTFFWRMEATTLDGTHDFSAGDTTATAISAVELSATAARYGTNGLNTPTSIDQYSFTATGITSTTRGAVAFKIQFKAWGGDDQIFSAFNSGAPSDQITLQTTGTDELLYRHRVSGGDNSTTTTTAANLALDAWYTFAIRYDTAANTRSVEVWSDDGTTLLHSESSSDPLDPQAALDTFLIGNGDNSMRCWIDNLVISDDDADPVQTWANYTSYTQISGGGGGSAPARVQHRKKLMSRAAANDDTFLLRATR